MDIVELLLKEKEGLLRRMDVINAALSVYQDNVLYSKESVTEKKPESNYFPISGRKEKQILWMFNNSINKALKIREIQDVYNEIVGNNETSIENVVRRLKSEQKLVLVKYNGKNLLSYWGLPEWIEGNDFKDEHKPNLEDLPDIIESEVVTH
jgi:hypothetical protein